MIAARVLRRRRWRMRTDMSTISKETAEKIAAAEGWDPEDEGRTDPRAFAVFEYVREENGATCYAVTWSASDFLAYARQQTVTRILWSAEPIFIARCERGRRMPR